jgi:hypothetical protein
MIQDVSRCHRLLVDGVVVETFSLIDHRLISKHLHSILIGRVLLSTNPHLIFHLLIGKWINELFYIW